MAENMETPQSAPAFEEADLDWASTAGPDRRLPVRRVLRFLLDHPDMAALRTRFPELSDEELRECADAAQTLVQDLRAINPRKSAYQTSLLRTEGLPDPDGPMHKGNIFRALLAPLKPGRLLDLGAGKGNFSLSAAAMGWEVTAVDARTMRWPDPAAEPDPEIAARIRAIRWIQADVRQFPIRPEEYDLICILGLLHHLEIADQIALLHRCAGTLLLLDTRIAPASVDREGSYAGMIVREHGETRAERDQIPTAAWGNARSFQHTEDSLVRLARDCGYAQIMAMRPPHRRDYTFYLCLPHLGTPGGRTKPRAARAARPVHRD